jgi:hypothetical protein
MIHHRMRTPTSNLCSWCLTVGVTKGGGWFGLGSLMVVMCWLFKFLYIVVLLEQDIEVKKNESNLFHAGLASHSVASTGKASRELCVHCTNS